MGAGTTPRFQETGRLGRGPFHHPPVSSKPAEGAARNEGRFVTEQEARALAARLTDIEIEELEYALGKERESRQVAALRAEQESLAVRFAS